MGHSIPLFHIGNYIIIIFNGRYDNLFDITGNVTMDSGVSNRLAKKETVLKPGVVTVEPVYKTIWSGPGRIKL